MFHQYQFEKPLCIAYLETLVLQDSLNSCVLSIWRELGLEYYTERPVSNNLALGILHFFGLASQTILYFLADDF